LYRLGLLLFFILFLASCSSVAKFEPKKINGDIDNLSQLSYSIKNINSSSALLENSFYIYKDTIYKKSIKKDYGFVCQNNEYKVITKFKNTVLISTKETIIEKKRAISCSIKNDLLAILFDDNSFYIKDLELDKILFKDSKTKTQTIWNNTASPIIADSFIVFPSLDGKIIIVDLVSYQNQTIDIDFNTFANISLLKKINNNILVATNNNIALIALNYQDNIKIKNNFTKFIKGKLYILAKNGYIYIYDKNLKELAKKKFPFSTLMGLVNTDKNIFILEENGFLIKTDLLLNKKEIFNISFDKKDKIYFGDSKIYFKDSYFVAY
jgi:hypothetical protein